MPKAMNNPPPEVPTNFFAKTLIVIPLLFVFPPAGIYLLWKNKKFDPAIRLILSVLFGFIFLYNSAGWLSPDTQPKAPPLPPVQVGDRADSADKPSGDEPPANSTQEEYIPPVLPAPEFTGNRLMNVHFLDVGQADSIIIQIPDGQIYLVDGGNRDDGSFVINYLRSLGVSEITALIATHPHEDHIGGLTDVLEAFPVKSVYMPDVTHTTKTFQDFVSAVEKSGAQKVRAKVGRSIPTDEPSLTMVFLAPNSNKYESLNNYSAVLKVSFEEVSFLLTGDAEALSEKEMLDNNRNVSATVLKVGHHGSRTSSSTAFLNAVKPSYAVISLGENNEYGYPHNETIQRLKATGAGILRTDVLGSIIIETDGKKLAIKAVR